MSRSFNVIVCKVRNVPPAPFYRSLTLRGCMECVAKQMKPNPTFTELERILTAKFGINWGNITEKQLLDAIAFLEVERNKHLERLRAFQRKRIREKAQGKRQPSRADLQALHAPAVHDK